MPLNDPKGILPTVLAIIIIVNLYTFASKDARSLLLITYINDFPLSSKRFLFIIYSDDTTLSSIIDSFMNIQIKTSHHKLIMNYPKLTNGSKLKNYR